jgi:hypothetical protein
VDATSVSTTAALSTILITATRLRRRTQYTRARPRVVSGEAHLPTRASRILDERRTNLTLAPLVVA